MDRLLTLYIIIAIASIAFAVFQVLLLFKLWNACNDINDIKRLVASMIVGVKTNDDDPVENNEENSVNDKS